MATDENKYISLLWRQLLFIIHSSQLVVQDQMPPNVKFMLLSAFAILIPLLTGVHGVCIPTGNDMSCTVGNGPSEVNTVSSISTPLNLLRIVYNGNVSLQIMAASTKFILIEPASDSDEHSLQITNISTNATGMVVRIRLSPNQARTILFPNPTAFNALNVTLSINVVQAVADANILKIFDGVSPTKASVVNYEVIFNTSGSNAGVRETSLMTSSARLCDLLYRHWIYPTYLAGWRSRPVWRFLAIITLSVWMGQTCHPSRPLKSWCWKSCDFKNKWWVISELWILIKLKNAHLIAYLSFWNQSIH